MIKTYLRFNISQIPQTFIPQITCTLPRLRCSCLPSCFRPSFLPPSLLSAAVSPLAVELDQERITENQKVHTLTYDLSNDKHLFAFYTFLIQTNHMEVFPSLSLSHIQQRHGHEMANKIKNEKNTVTHPTLHSLSFCSMSNPLRRQTLPCM